MSTSKRQAPEEKPEQTTEKEATKGRQSVDGNARAKKPVKKTAAKSKPTNTTKKKAPPKPMGRPRKVFIKEEFEKLCAMQCTEEEIAGWFGFSVDTLNNRCKENYANEEGKPLTFSETYKRFSVDGKISLRRTQFRWAEKSAAMAIFLGKVYLGQRDVPDMQSGDEDEASVSDKQPLVINYNYVEPKADYEEGGEKTNAKESKPPKKEAKAD